MSTSEKARKQDEGIISESKPKVQKVESDDEYSDFDCCDKSDGKPVHAYVIKEVTGSSGKEPTVAPSSKISEEVNNNSETGVGIDNWDGNTRVRRSGGKLKLPERLVSIPCFEI